MVFKKKLRKNQNVSSQSSLHIFKEIYFYKIYVVWISHLKLLFRHYIHLKATFLCLLLYHLIIYCPKSTALILSHLLSLFSSNDSLKQFFHVDLFNLFCITLLKNSVPYIHKIFLLVLVFKLHLLENSISLLSLNTSLRKLEVFLSNSSQTKY